MPSNRIPVTGGTGADFGNDHAARLRDLYAMSGDLLTGVSGTNTIAAAARLTIAAYAAGMKFSFVPAAVNTANVMIAINGLALVALKDAEGNQIPAGYFKTNRREMMEFTGTEFRLFNTVSSAVLKRSVIVLQKPNNNNGGALVGGNVRTRYALSTPVINDHGLTVDSSTNIGRITIVAGATFTKIHAEATLVSAGPGGCGLFLRNISTGLDFDTFRRSAYHLACVAVARAYNKVFSAGDQIEVQYVCEVGQPTNGLGVKVGDPAVASGGALAPEQFGFIEFEGY